MDTGLTQEQVLKNLQNIGYKAPLTNPVGGAIANGMITQDGTNPISAQTIGVQKPAVLPDRPISSPYTGMGEQFLASAKGVQTQEAEKVSKYEQGIQEGTTDIMSLISGIGDQEAKRQEAYQQQGVFDKKGQYDKIVSDMEAANLRTRRQIEEIQKNNPEGQSRQALQATINEIERKNASYQADQAITLSAVGRDFDRAREIVDMKIDAETSAMKAELEAKKYFFEFNKDMFTKSEERQYNAMLKKEEREYTEMRDERKKIEELRIQVLENGGSPALAQRVANSQSYSEAVSMAGSLAGDQLGAEYQRLQIENMKAEIAEKKQKIASNSPEAKALEDRASSLDKLSLVNDIIESPYLGQVVGVKNPFTYWTPGSNEQYVKNQFNQLKGSLSLEQRELLKGSGAISDFEFRVLGQAASSLGKNLSNEATMKELKKVRGVFANASGLPAKVKLVDPVTNTSQIVDATREGINQAVADGLLVEYQ